MEERRRVRLGQPSLPATAGKPKTRRRRQAERWPDNSEERAAWELGEEDTAGREGRKMLRWGKAEELTRFLGIVSVGFGASQLDFASRRASGRQHPPAREGDAATMHLQKLQRTIGYEFKDIELLTEAVTHPSIAHERGTECNHHNQRMEFLGDAVLQLILTDRIYKLYPDLPEGKLTQIRAHLANRHTLYDRAQAIDLGRHLMLGKGEEASGGRERLSNLADGYEALLGAIYLDGGIRAVRKFILTQFAEEFSNIKQTTPRQNPKGRLQELLQAHSPCGPVYRVVHESGPDHSKYFEAVVEWEGREIGRGNGSSKKQAETVAAEAALAALPSLTAQAKDPVAQPT